MALSHQEQFKAMLNADKKIFEQLSTMGIFLNSPDSAKHPEYVSIKAKHESLKARYNARQDDYKNNTLYNLGTSINEYADKTVAWFKDTWNSLFGLGLAPLAIPIAIAAGATLSLTAIAYFIYKYYSETSTDYNEGLKTLELLARHNPKLAEELAKSLTNVKNKETETGLFNQMGTGLKVALITLGIGGTAWAGYSIAKDQKWI